jgi:hypothetical protein
MGNYDKHLLPCVYTFFFFFFIFLVALKAAGKASHLLILSQSIDLPASKKMVGISTRFQLISGIPG